MKNILAGLVFASLPALAHHSFAAEYDNKQPVTFTGVVIKLDWMNPHLYFYVDATDKDGKVTHWACETGNPNALAAGAGRKLASKPAIRSLLKATVPKMAPPQ